MTVIEQATLNPRPGDIPAHWLIFCAPRPLYGHRTWKAEADQPFYDGGTLYAGVDTNDTAWARDYCQENIRLDARLLRYVTVADMTAWCREYCAVNGYDFDEMSEWMTDADVRVMYMTETGTRTVELFAENGDQP